VSVFQGRPEVIGAPSEEETIRRRCAQACFEPAGSCRSTQEHLLEGTVWIYGFWTGLNYVAAASDQTQAKIDVAAIVAEVEKTCAQQNVADISQRRMDHLSWV
jgi:hypothetical protein